MLQRELSTGTAKNQCFGDWRDVEIQIAHLEQYLRGLALTITGFDARATAAR